MLGHGSPERYVSCLARHFFRTWIILRSKHYQTPRTTFTPWWLDPLVICMSNWWSLFIYLWVMLTSALRTLIKNPIKESFYGKRKKTVNVLTVFFISHKNNVKIFFNWILNQCPALVSISLYLFICRLYAT